MPEVLEAEVVRFAATYLILPSLAGLGRFFPSPGLPPRAFLLRPYGADLQRYLHLLRSLVMTGETPVKLASNFQSPKPKAVSADEVIH